MASPDLAHVLAELAAIQRDVKALVDLGSMLRGSATEICSRIGMLMASITAPPPAVAPVDNGMLAAVNQRLAGLDDTIGHLVDRINARDAAVNARLADMERKAEFLDDRVLEMERMVERAKEVDRG